MPEIDALEATLLALRTAARRGDLGGLLPLSARLEEQMAAISQSLPEEERLQSLRASAAETAALLDAALRGLTAARTRLAEINAVRSGAGTYGDDGQRRRLSVPARDSKRL